jgi:hypothetical protein
VAKSSMLTNITIKNTIIFMCAHYIYIYIYILPFTYCYLHVFLLIYYFLTLLYTYIYIYIYCYLYLQILCSYWFTIAFIPRDLFITCCLLPQFYIHTYIAIFRVCLCIYFYFHSTWPSIWPHAHLTTNKQQKKKQVPIPNISLFWAKHFVKTDCAFKLGPRTTADFFLYVIRPPIVFLYVTAFFYLTLNEKNKSFP